VTQSEGFDPSSIDRDVLDVIIVGAGLSGIGAACHLQKTLPHKTFTILEARDAIGGTWDLFRYPGIRSDSDMFTFGYAFRPWLGDNSIADGASILSYLRGTAQEAGLERKIRFGHKVIGAAWHTADALWTLDIATGEGARRQLRGRFLFMCAGYYDYAGGYRPEFPGLDRYHGIMVHPQAWPSDLDYAGKSVLVIGSGATSVTLVPALAKGGAKVTMLQRSPSFVASLPARDRFAQRMRARFPEKLAYRIVRWRNIFLSIFLYTFARRKPADMRARLIGLAQKKLGPDIDASVHFNPRYNPWDQRLCLVPDDDLFDTLRSGKAEIVTDEIETFTAEGVQVRSGRELKADIVVTATGLKLLLNGGVTLVVDGQPIEAAKTLSYKGAMLSGVPNFAYTLGYTNASWTLKSDLTSAWVCRVLRRMERCGAAFCVPRHDPAMATAPLIDFSSGYIQRALDQMPKQGVSKPWRLNQNYVLDLLALRFGRLKDKALAFGRLGDPL
jgi:cation diffusion facilitator CzcD-associated flavoprotein CzcO